MVFACFPLSFFLFPFLLSCLSCDGFCRIPFRLRFLSTFPIFSSPAAFTFLSRFCFSSVISFRLQIEFFIILLHFHPAVALFCLVLRSGTKPKRRQKRRQNSRQAAWHGPSQELASLLPHPATTATTPTATAGPSYASAAGFCLTTTSKAPTPPPSL